MDFVFFLLCGMETFLNESKRPIVLTKFKKSSFFFFFFLIFQPRLAETMVM